MNRETALPPGISIREAELSDAVLDTLIAFSKAWEKEDSCRGYRANTVEDIEGRRVFLAFDQDRPVGYLFGLTENTQKASSVMPAGTPCFEAEELYVLPAPPPKTGGRSCIFTWRSSEWNSGAPGCL